MARKLLIAWLNDAYAMESALIPILENHANDAEDHPDVQARIRQHCEETRRHADLVKGCVERLGSSTSATKTGLAMLSGYLQSGSTGMFSDELVKNALIDYATEHFEIACYRALATAADQLGHADIAAVCNDILREEEAMASWLQEQLPMTIRTAVIQEASTDGSAARAGS